MSEDRYWGLEFSNGSNRISEVADAAGLEIVGLVDEEVGGVIGYLVATAAPAIIERLNGADPDADSQEEIDATRAEMEAKLR